MSISLHRGRAAELPPEGMLSLLANRSDDVRWLYLHELVHVQVRGPYEGCVWRGGGGACSLHWHMVAHLRLI